MFFPFFSNAPLPGGSLTGWITPSVFRSDADLSLTLFSFFPSEVYTEGRFYHYFSDIEFLDSSCYKEQM